ncbi:hypothetical protein QN277_013700 [Acacia crassicarpa]|uniref:Uncharacterized protein n=1 Tax=Acacia crassicarpa TaxID=499986 RepID=A0AAE1TFY2_9FABA|nr:hypothetical protein QN277_013700 [Acacia crassicarpa]
MNADHFDFEFPTLISDPSTSPARNDIVFWGQLMHPQSEPHPPLEANHSLLRSRSLVKSDTGRSDGFLKPLPGGNRSRRSASCRKYRNGLFGILKFPVEMNLSDMKMRQGRREPLPVPQLPEDDSADWASGGDGGQSCWEMVRPLRRRSPLLSALVKATFGCIPRF